MQVTLGSRFRSAVCTSSWIFSRNKCASDKWSDWRRYHGILFPIKWRWFEIKPLLIFKVIVVIRFVISLPHDCIMSIYVVTLTLLKQLWSNYEVIKEQRFESCWECERRRLSYWFSPTTFPLMFYLPTNSLSPSKRISMRLNVTEIIILLLRLSGR